MSFNCKKEEFDWCFKQLDRPVEESRPDRFPPLSQLRHGKIAIVYLEEDNSLILQECRLRRLLFIQPFLRVL